MGIFKAILGAMGFQQEGEEVVSKKPVVVQAKPIGENNVSKIEKTETKQVSVNSLSCFSPTSNKDVKSLIDSLKNGEPCIVNLSNLSSQDIKTVLDYLGGAIYALEGSISKLQGELYVISPKNVNIISR